MLSVIGPPCYYQMQKAMQKYINAMLLLLNTTSKPSPCRMLQIISNQHSDPNIQDMLCELHLCLCKCMNDRERGRRSVYVYVSNINHLCFRGILHCCKLDRPTTPGPIVIASDQYCTTCFA